MHFKKILTYVMLVLLSHSLLPKLAFADEPSAANFWSGLNVGGYSSAGVAIHRNKSAEAAVNEVSLLMTWSGDSRWSFFSELEFERPLSWNDDSHFNRKESHIDLERLYVDYNFSEKVNLRLGRFLTPNSRWNLLHASPLVWTSTRPLATRRLFPTATNGLMLHGSLPVSDYALDYMVFSEVIEDQQEDRFELPFEHVYGGRVALSKQWNVGLSLLSFQEKKVAVFNNQHQKYQMLGLDFVTYVGATEISGEGFARYSQDGRDGGSGGYLQTAVPLNNLGLYDWYWLTRLETLQRPNEKSSERWVIGATWRLKPMQLLKLEFTGGHGDQPESPRGFISSFAFFF